MNKEKEARRFGVFTSVGCAVGGAAAGLTSSLTTIGSGMVPGVAISMAAPALVVAGVAGLGACTRSQAPAWECGEASSGLP